MPNIKDSGKRAEFDSGMVRDVEDDKVDYTLIFDGPMLERWAGHLTAGARKYAARNWMKAEGEAEYERFRRSALRHFIQWFRGDVDEDHAAAVFFNINGAEYVFYNDPLPEPTESYVLNERERLLAGSEAEKLGPVSAGEVIYAVDQGNAEMVADDYNYLLRRVGELTKTVGKMRAEKEKTQDNPYSYREPYYKGVEYDEAEDGGW